MSSTTTYEVIFDANYNNTDFIRTYALQNVDSLSAATEIVRGKVQAINSSIEGGSASEIVNLFVSDDYDSSQGVGTLKGIDNVKIKAVTETPIEKPVTRMLLTNENGEEATDNGEENITDNRNEQR